MFPINFNFPFRKKDGSLTTIDDAISSGGGSYTLPTASDAVKGGVKIGQGLTMEGEILKNANPTPFSLPTASAETLGGIKVGNGLSIDGNGTLSASGGGSVNPFDFSETPKKIGSWINGDEVWIVTKPFTLTTGGAVTLLTDTDIKLLIYGFGYFTPADPTLGHPALLLNAINNEETVTSHVQQCGAYLQFKPLTKEIKVYNNAPTFDGRSGHAVLIYTKAAAQ